VKRVALALGLLLAAELRAAAEVEQPTFALVIGFNGRPPSATDESIQPLRYADDDALAFYQLQKELGAEVVLLTVPDAETRRRYPGITDNVRPPTMDQITRSIDALNARMDAAARKGAKPAFVFFYSGHGARDGGDAALTLLDGTLSQAAMQERVLAKVRAPVVHLFIDSCHAEAVARPRDVEAKTVEIRPQDLLEHLSRTSSVRFPHVGLVVASTSGASTHEWDIYQSGVFTHEVISGLRGVADVNHDGRVEYGELAAFLTAANREVIDPRARVASIVQPPASGTHEALSRLGGRSTLGRLTGIPPTAGRFFIEDKRGNRILDGHAEPGFSISVGVPPDELLFLRNRDEEAELTVKAGSEAQFGGLAFRTRPLRPRGAMEASLRDGLFLMPYGPAYYSGYVDRLESGTESARPATVESPSTNRVLKWTLRGGAAAFLATSALFGALAWDARSDFQNTSLQRQAAEANDRFKLDSTLAFTFALSGVVCAAASYVVGLRR
jgi:caspase domain-containing protein